MRTVRLREMLPLGQPEVREPPRQSTGHRKGVDVGEAIQPDRFRADQAAEQQGDAAGGRAGRNDDRGSLTHHDAQNGETHPNHGKFVPAICIRHAVETMAADLIASVQRTDESAVAVSERGRDP